MKLFFYLLLYTNVAISQTWTQLTDFTGLERDDGVAVVINNKAYVGTGLRAGFTIGNDFYSLDLSSGTWSAIASMPAGSNRQYASAFTYSNYIFVTCGLGNAGAVFNDTYRYDVTADTWTTVASKPGNGVLGACSFTLNNKAYLICGKFANGAVSDEIWEYDLIANTWIQKNNFPFGGRWRASAAVLNNIPYMIFGLDNNGSYRKEMYKYNQNSDTWSKVADFPAPNKARTYAAMQGLTNKLILFAGTDTTKTYYNDCWFFDEINSFVQGPALPSFGRKGGISFVSGNKFYYTCGINVSDTRLKETWLMDVPAGIKENSSGISFSVYPNPCHNLLYMYSDTGLHFKVELYNLIGERIAEGESSNTLDLSDIPKGIYFARFIKDNSGFEIKKIIKE